MVLTCSSSWSFSDEEPAPTVEAAADEARIRKAIERSLVALDRQGLAWLDEKKCASCHHVPMMLWSFNEAQRHGFAIDPKSLEAGAGAAGMVPKGDTVEHGAHMTLGLSAIPVLDDATTTLLRKHAAHLVKVQQADGNWELRDSDNPFDRAGLWTLWTALAVSSARDLAVRDGKTPIDEAWVASPQRAEKWLAERTLAAEPLFQVPQLLIHLKAGRRDAAQSLLTSLQESQHADGGWAWKKDQPSDALMTGQALYALNVAGVAAADLIVKRACEFLIATQPDDGMWRLQTTTKRGNQTEIFSYPATAWATMGLLRSLPPDRSRGP